MASAQRWVDNQCCMWYSRVLTMRHQLAATGLILPSDTWEYVMQILLTCFVYMAIYDLEIQLFRSFSVL